MMISHQIVGVSPYLTAPLEYLAHRQNIAGLDKSFLKVLLLQMLVCTG